MTRGEAERFRRDHGKANAERFSSSHCHFMGEGERVSPLLVARLMEDPFLLVAGRRASLAAHENRRRLFGRS